MFELGPAADEMSRLVTGVHDDQLDDPTPCTDWSVSDLLAHIHQFATVFTQNALKDPVDPPHGLDKDWRDAVPAQVADMAQAWRQESAWAGDVSAGGIDMAAADNAVVAIEELVVHSWDLARATGQEFDVDESSLTQVEKFFDLFGAEPFGPSTDTDDDATHLQAVIARTGRDTSWTPPN